MEVRNNNTVGTTMDPSSFSLDSPISFSQTHRDYLLSELTRQLASTSIQQDEQWKFLTSPLSRVGPWLGRSQFTTKSDVGWELLYEAAAQVAKLKMEAMEAQLNPNRGNPSLRNSPLYAFPKREKRCFHHQSRSSGATGMPHFAWPPARAESHHHRKQGGVRGEYLGSDQADVPPVKRKSAGTGVFIPQSQRVRSRKNPTDVVIGTRDVLKWQERRSIKEEDENGLPTDWIY